MNRLLLVGHPVSHSLSPAMHNAAFRALGLDWSYAATDVLPGDLPAYVDAVRRGELSGLNVTIPHKVSVCALLEALDPLARCAGAVNTVVRTAAGAVGHNTDVEGIRLAFADSAVELRGSRALVLGAGGSGRAAVVALAASGAVSCGILARNAGAAAELAELASDLGLAPGTADPLAADVIVNCTPVGMGALAAESPLAASQLKPGQAVLDMVYSPMETLLLRNTRAAGATPVPGLSVLLHQGAAAFKLWTGLEPPLDAMAAAIGMDTHA